MADKDDIKEQKAPEKDEPKNQTAPEKKKDDKKSEVDSDAKRLLGIGLLPLIIIAVSVVFSAGMGLGLGRLMAGSYVTEQTEVTDESKDEQPDYLWVADDKTREAKEVWHYALEPVVANLDEPGALRYVRLIIMLEISPEMNKEKAPEFFDEKKPFLTDWLHLYLASLSVEDCRGDKNLRRIQTQILDAFNEKLFPEAKPLIKHVLFKEFAIQ